MPAGSGNGVLGQSLASMYVFKNLGRPAYFGEKWYYIWRVIFLQHYSSQIIMLFCHTFYLNQNEDIALGHIKIWMLF